MAEVKGEQRWRVERVPTGVANLDRVIDGGLTRGSLVLIVGGPGTGKTVLAEQMAFHWAGQGQNVLWLVMLGEPNEKLLVNLSELQFFDRSQIGAGIQLVNLSRYLRQGFEEQLAAIRDTVRSGSYSFVIIDGFQSLRCFLKDAREVRLFLSELSSELALAGITLIVTLDANPVRHWEAAELTMSDCIIALDRVYVAGHERRRLEVTKLRGRRPISGHHTFTIDGSGLHVHPRFEAILPRGEPAGTREQQPFGVPGLDRLLGGGVLEGSSTLIAGSLGTGKSMLASYFLAEGLRRGEPALAMCLADKLDRFLQQGDSFGLPLRRGYEQHLLEVEPYDPAHWDPDSCAERILAGVEGRGIRRLVIDGIEAAERDLEATGRTLDFLIALAGYLSTGCVVAVFTYELGELLATSVTFPTPLLGMATGNLILLRFAEREGRLRRLVNVVKTRHAEHSPVVAELLFEDGKLDVVPRSRTEEEVRGEVAYGAEPSVHEGERLRLRPPAP